MEAFERHANDAKSPAVPRQTRTKTRAKALASDDSGSVISTISEAHAKFNTPNLTDIRNNAKGYTTPQSVTAIPSQTGSNLPLSKLAHLNRAASATKLPQYSRDSSVEDTKRGVPVSCVKCTQQSSSNCEVNFRLPPKINGANEKRN